MFTSHFSIYSRLCLVTLTALLLTAIAAPTLCAARGRKIVVLSHGWSGNAKAMETMAKHVKKAGYEPYSNIL